MTLPQEPTFRLLFDSTPDACLLLRDSRVVDCNPAAVAMLKAAAKADLLGLHPWDFSPDSQPDGQPSAAKARDLIAQAKQNGFQRFEWAHRRLTGEVFPVEVLLTLLPGGEEPQFHAVLRDISYRKRVEAELSGMARKYRSIFENFQDVYFETSLDGTILEMSPSISLCTGYRREDLLGRSAGPLYRDPDRRRFLIEKLLLEGGFSDQEVEYLDHDGSPLPFSLSARLERDASGAPQHIVGILRDIRQRKALERTLRDHVDHLEKLERLNDVLRGEGDLERIMNRALETARDILGADRAFLLFPADPEASSWSVQMEATVPEHPGGFAKGTQFPMQETMRRLFRAALEAPGALEWGGLDGDTPPLPQDAAFSIRSRLACALRPRLGKPWLFGVHQCSHARSWTDEDKSLLREMGYRLSDALSVLLLIRDLRHSERRFREIVFSMGDWVWETDVFGRITYSSEQVEKILGYPSAETLGRRPIDFMPQQERERLVPLLLEHQKAHSPIRNLVNWNLRKDGGEVCLLTNGVPRWDDQGRFQGFRGVDKDITEVKRAEKTLLESERKYRELFESAALGLLIFRDGAHIADANRYALNLLGYGRDELLRLTAFDLVHPGDLAARPVLSADQVPPEEIVRLERRYRKKSGEYLPVEVWACRYQEDNLLVMFHDIGDRKRMESLLFQSQKMEAVGTLAAGIAHDFNNLLQAIGGYAELLLDDRPAEAPDNVYLARIRESASRGATLVRNLLSFSRAEAQDFAPMSLNDEVRRVAGILERTIPRMVRLHVRLSPDLPPLMGSPPQIEQVLLNLGTNARDAMPNGGDLYLETEFRDEPGDRSLYLCVRDTGCGMDEQTLSHIFDPFFTTKPLGKGTGLGLSTAYGIVKSHGGAITCRSAPGEGSCFELRFPALLDHSFLPEAPGEPSASPAGGGETILVVDDEPEILDVCVTILTRGGYRVLTATSGEEALRLLEEEPGPVHLTILDLNMPGMGGRPTLDKLRARDPAARVLVSTGYSGTDAGRELLEAGAVGILAKPYRRNDLLEAVRHHLE